ncbi:MAG: efflux RND transporter periplasmic adaptor subunit [Verrucomicrobia bacterium]|nr:efflux RND transporter periplasmic adaptor subunit [Verrucomicrobiota bacterium]
MNKVSSNYWVVFSVLTVLTSCQKSPMAGPAGPPEVLVTEVIQKEVPVIREFVGTLNGVENAQVRARETGYLQTIAYQQGGYVKKGDLLFEIDPRPFIAALDQAKGQLQEAQATLLGVEFDAKAAKELYEKKVISEQQYTNETQGYQTKLAAVAAAQAAVDNAQLNLSFTKITSPLDGIAGEQQAQIGDLVGTGENQVLTTVSQIDPIWFFLPISEQTYWEFADALKEWMNRPEAERAAKVELILADGTVYPEKGKFAFVARYVDTKTGTIQIAVSFPNPKLTLRPGQYGRARAEIKTIPDALLIPQQALSQLQGYDQVAVVNPDGKAEIRSVKVGQLYGRNMIVVTEGLKLGEKVIVEGFQRVRQGMEVSAKPFEDASTTQGAQNDSEKNSNSRPKSTSADQPSGQSGVRSSG